MKNPSAKISLKAIIGAHSRDLFIKRRIWKKFYENLLKSRKDGKVNDDQISALFYQSHILENVLSEFEEDEVDKITPDFVLEEIEKASARELNARKKKVLEFWKKEASKVEEKVEKDWLERIQKIKRHLRISAVREANRKSIIYTSFLTPVVLGVMYGVYWACKKLGIDGFLTVIIPILSGGGGIVGLWKRFRGFLKNRMITHLYTKRLSEAQLE